MGVTSKRKSKRPPLTEAEWEEVFRIRCRSKRGDKLDGS
jgi:hypothetical protein